MNVCDGCGDPKKLYSHIASIHVKPQSPARQLHVGVQSVQKFTVSISYIRKRETTNERPRKSCDLQVCPTLDTTG